MPGQAFKARPSDAKGAAARTTVVTQIAVQRFVQSLERQMLREGQNTAYFTIQDYHCFYSALGCDGNDFEKGEEIVFSKENSAMFAVS